MNRLSEAQRLTNTAERPMLGLALRRGWIARALCLVACCGAAAPLVAEDAQQASLDETREIMGRWIETQQIIAKERSDWQQGKEILEGRIELVEREIAALEEAIKASQNSFSTMTSKTAELNAEDASLKATLEQLKSTVMSMETDVRALTTALPTQLREKLRPLTDRMTANPGKERTAGERYQDVLGILNELNKANSEITVAPEVHDLADGRKAEVQAIYIGLAAAYFVSPNGEAGVGRPTPEGWRWEPSKAIARDITTALEVIQGKHMPSYVPLPVKIQ